jgi:hypothetical protein
MIAVDKRGQLGNQMFQYAFAVAAARRLNTTFRYDVSDLAPHFMLLQPSVRGLVFRRREIISDDRDDPDDVFATLTDRTRYGGYFYGYGYVRHAADAGRAFTLHPDIGSRFHRRYGGLVAGGYVCCHARLTDFFTYRDNVTLPPGYYRRALDVIDTDRPVVFVSDDLAMVAATLDGLPGARFEETDAVTALLLLRPRVSGRVEQQFAVLVGHLAERPARPACDRAPVVARRERGRRVSCPSDPAELASDPCADGDGRDVGILSTECADDEPASAKVRGDPPVVAYWSLTMVPAASVRRGWWIRLTDIP